MIMERKEAIEVVKKNWPDSSFTRLREALRTLIPELKGDEDDGIREAIIKCLKWLQHEARWTDVYGISFDSIFSWLEKQGKNNMGISEATKQELEDNLNKALEKETPESWNKFLDEQKPADKVEPKFHEGDWVVVNDGRIGRIIECTKDFADVDLEFSCLSTNVNNIRLWTIQDAKDGDVLAVTMYPEGTWIGIFKEQNGCTFSSHCFVSTDGIFKQGTYGHGNGRAIHPATKEQRDTLIAKMKEAGYEWDAEKKELKEIEPAEWSEEDEMMLESVIDKIGNLGTGEMCKEWLKSLKTRYTWKPSDEQMDAVKSAALDVAKFSSRSEQLRLENEPYYKALMSLYNDLEKLREKWL